MAPDQTTCGFVYTSGLEIHVCDKPPLHDGLHRPAPTPGTPHAPAEDAREYRCPQCSRWGKWTDGVEESDDDTPDEFWCQTCGAETPIERMDSRPQEATGATDTAGTETDRGTGAREPHARSEATVDIVARILVGSDWDEGVRITDIGTRETVQRMAEEIEASLRTVNYLEAAASLRNLGHVEAARALESFVKDLEDGE